MFTNGREDEWTTGTQSLEAVRVREYVMCDVRPAVSWLLVFVVLFRHRSPDPEHEKQFSGAAYYILLK